MYVILTRYFEALYILFAEVRVAGRPNRATTSRVLQSGLTLTLMLLLLLLLRMLTCMKGVT